MNFSYNNEKYVLKDLSFKAEENSLLAFVGMSGSGKSTIAKLISGFWNVDSGEIRIGGVPLSDISLRQNMELVSYVSQENFLFELSIIENMKIAKSDASLEEIQNACKRASIHEFIIKLQDGYNTIVSEAGSSLSGGERQRLTIARALLKNSPIIVLDEATAYSDPDNEAIIQQSINELIKDKTVIMIAHRLSTIVNANMIIVLDDGIIKNAGSHVELLKNSKLYRKMWNSHINIQEAEETNCD